MRNVSGEGGGEERAKFPLKVQINAFCSWNIGSMLLCLMC